MEKLVNCAFNIDTACVELHFTEGSIYSINCTAVENEVADNRFQRSELDYLIYSISAVICHIYKHLDRFVYITFCFIH
mgnify:CR=1 FL=1